jgi:hypothetical protein
MKDGIVVKCITVYTSSFDAFSDIYEDVIKTPLKENEEVEVSGILVSEAGNVPENYISRMKVKPEVVVMRIKEGDITILQHRDVFEILIPDKEIVSIT